MKGFLRTLLVRVGLALVALEAAHAHFALLQPPSALSVENGGKGAPPCGEGPDSNVVTQVQGGHPLAIRLSEFVYHPGHYRFALSVNSRAELPADPDVVQDNGVSVEGTLKPHVKENVAREAVRAF